MAHSDAQEGNEGENGEWSVAWQVETTDHEMTLRQVGVSGAVWESAGYRYVYWPTIGRPQSKRDGTQ